MKTLIDWLNFAVLAATLIVLVFYAFDTHRIAEQTTEGNLRPIILRQGVLDWNNFPPLADNGPSRLINIKNLKNIAVDIHGYVILSNKKYTLFFGNEVSTFEGGALGLLQKWGWLPMNANLYAGYKAALFTASQESNQLYIEYQDIEGNKYYTAEDRNYNQVSRKLNEKNVVRN